MSRPRTPSNVLDLRGAFDKNPQRRREDPKVEAGLGDAPDYFTDDERKVWAEIEQSAPEGVLSRADRIAVEMLTDLIVRFRARQPLKAAERNHMLNLLSRLGMTAADRSRVAKPDDGEDQLDIWDVLGAKGGAA